MDFLPTIPNTLAWVFGIASVLSLAINVWQWRRGADIRHSLSAWGRWAEAIHHQTIGYSSRYITVLDSDPKVDDAVARGAAEATLDGLRDHAKMLAEDIRRTALLHGVVVSREGQN